MPINTCRLAWLAPTLMLVVGCSGGSSGGAALVPQSDALSQVPVACGGAICDSSNPCTAATCDAAANKCVYTPKDAACDDGNACTQGDKCFNGVCTAGANACVDAASDVANDAAAQDTGGYDTAVPDSASVDGGAQLVAGSVVISEIHYNPWGQGNVQDVTAEWFEVHNPGNLPVDLSGATIRDKGGDKYNILGANTTVPAKGYLVFGASADKQLNGGVEVDHVYGNSLTLDNKGADALIIDKDGVVIDQVLWDTAGGWPYLNARAMSLQPDKLDAAANDDPASWCGAQSDLPSGDKGTPGEANDLCDYADEDNDGIADGQDNCLNFANPTQVDADKNGKGDVCEGPAPLCGNLKVDAGEECDDGNKFTGDGCSSYCLTETPVLPGAVIISEFMANPKAVSDDKGEWIELYNTTDQDIDLNGVVLSVTVSSPFKQWLSASAPLLIKAKGYLLIGNNDDMVSNGGVKLDFAYENKFAISSKVATLALTSATKVVDAVAYDAATWPLESGLSLSLDPAALDANKNDDVANWCAGQQPFGAGDLGSPGVTNPGCAGADEDKDGDKVPDKFDNCPDDKNTDQVDGDGDTIGDACDNCPGLTNKDQSDTNKDGVGDACEKPGCGNGVLDPGEQCDDGNSDGGDGCTFTCQTGAKLKEGDLIINEIMADPSAAKDEDGEWVEVFNSSGAAIDLGGLWLKDAKGGKHKIEPTAALVVEAGKYVVFGVNADSKLNGGAPVAYAWKGLTLPNTGGAFSVGTASLDIDLVAYTPGQGGWPTVKTGVTLQLKADTLGAVSNDAGGSWCHPTSTFGAGDKGTPGAANEACADAKPACGNGKLEQGEACDDGNLKDGDGCSGKCVKEAQKLAAGDLLITEMMIKSVSGTDNGEWFEVHNTTKQNIDLSGIVISAKSGDHTIDGKDKPVLINAGGWLVLGRSLDPTKNGETPVTYSYGALALGNGGGEMALTAGAVEIDRVVYTASAPWPGVHTGKSIQLKPALLNHTANKLGTSWCLSIASYGSKGMAGTPGQPNNCL